MQRTGKCLCGAVSYRAELRDDMSACHCSMCRRWAGGLLLAIGTNHIDWEGQEHIAVFASSEWAERGFCSKCGSNLFYRMTATKHQGFTSLAFGTLDDPSGLELKREWFIDNKPEAYALAGERQRVTEAEALAMLEDG